MPERIRRPEYRGALARGFLHSKNTPRAACATGEHSCERCCLHLSDKLMGAQTPAPQSGVRLCHSAVPLAPPSPHRGEIWTSEALGQSAVPPRFAEPVPNADLSPEHSPLQFRLLLAPGSLRRIA